ncbi:MAG: FMN-binding protein [Bacteroidales bacterium]|nr:FMN-binding protein [Bacteroidales bacterium]MBR1782044.1 FMN-binding protein [Bacteroidales bacterium]
MKRFILIASLLALAATTSPVKKQADGTVTINTTTLKADEGCFGPTPVIIYLDAQEHVSKIEALPNTETPSYWNLVMEKLSTVWNGLPASEAVSLEVDAVSGATYSSEGLISNVRSGLTYYLQSK